MKYDNYVRSFNRTRILDSSDTDNIKGYILDQISDPYSSSVNYFKPLKKSMVDEPDDLIDFCKKILNNIEVTYPDISFDIINDDRTLINHTGDIYKFFIKNISDIVYVFLKEYISNNKNRKNLTTAYSDINFDNYPKEEYGKKEYYILVSKLNKIINDIKNSNLRLIDMINYINKASDSSVYVNNISNLVTSEFIVDNGIVKNILENFIDSDDFSMVCNKLTMWINKKLISPYLTEMGYTKDSSIQYVEDTEVIITDENDTMEENINE